MKKIKAGKCIPSFGKIKAATAVIFLSTSLFLSGCSELFPFTENTSEPYFVLTSEPGSDIKPSETIPTSEPESILPDPSEIVTEWEKPEPFPDFSGELTPEIRNDREFNAYMKYILRNRIQSFAFYAYDGYSIDNDLLLYRFSLPYVSTNYSECDDGSCYWKVFIQYYPGTLIADAYESGDTSKLSDEEIKVLEKAKEFIENYVAPVDNILMKERLIHDYICYSTVYTNPGSDDPVPRYCTVTGLFLDGEANCQGYADAFNMLCRMAGLKSYSQSGSAEGQLHVWNIFLLEDTWYSVDVTYDDTTYNTSGYYYPAYIYFNAGLDILEETHYIPKSNEVVPTAEYSDDNYFYYSDVFADSGWFAASHPDDVPLAEQEIADLLTDAWNNGNETVSYLIRDQYLESKNIVNDIQSYIEDTPNPITISTFHVGNNTYICGEPK